MTSPEVTISPARRGGRPTMKGISTEVLADCYWIGDDVETEYSLTRHELLVTLWFEATYGQPRYRRWWRDWARQVSGPLHRVTALDADDVPLPPTQADRV